MIHTHQQATCNFIPFRIRIGVTGHRQLPNDQGLSKQVEKVLKEAVMDLFDELSKKCIRKSSRTPVVYSIITSLAEGADRLVAREVLKFPGATIEVVLPLSREEYVEDFGSEESRLEFDDLLRQARRPIALRERNLSDGHSPDDLREEKRKAYEEAGYHVVDQCDLLIAVWNGEPSERTGSTSSVVTYARERRRPLIAISSVEPYAVKVEKGYGLNARSIERIEMFNRFQIPAASLQEGIENEYAELFVKSETVRKNGNDVVPDIPDDKKNLIKNVLLPFYVRTEKIARKNQKFYLRIGLIAYLFSAAAVAAVTVGILFQGNLMYPFLLEFVLLLAVLVMVGYANHCESHKKWIESRFLAERLRSAMFFAACGVEISPIRLPPYMGTAHHSDDWMVKTFYEIWNRLPLLTACKGAECGTLIECVRLWWVGAQIVYHRDKSIRARKINYRLGWSGLGIFFMAMAAALTHLLLHVQGSLSEYAGIESVLTLAAIVLPAAGASMGGIRAHREYTRIENRSKNMEAVLMDLYESYSKVSTPEGLDTLLRETDELMLRETQDWLMLMRFVELKPSA